ncbi:RNA polymerase sigma factor [Chitinophaga pinensis]|uniref:RNA polymerase, sigma-24 subunit, ECF subfamily n=1 Tax=Chitinophaga pinensis (strain ATCC 43595 / DSM 2588 / LMG 13176 / NBRC 15968 / NCIMB 11800 / UQM 2034) TaxID=485918 RepID=A0A979G4W7_CHIPD|nr:sigma-70 family RNA polymerase sigma factor [Chitinophaga pinensis]ACU60688.1 RNA polymerase, sigma-24 subunit, ECF subfamily [Chitinophaga pinensis DSM 2588]
MSGESPTITVIHFKGQIVPFEQLYKTNFKRLLTKARSLLDDDGKAEDAVQEFFVQLWERKSIEITGSSVEAYLMMGIHYKCLSILNKEQRVNKWKQGYVYALLAQDINVPNLLQESPREEQLKMLEKAIDKLTNNQQEVMRKCYMENRSQKEVAAEMNIKVNTLKSHIERSLVKFKSFFQEKCGTSL